MNDHDLIDELRDAMRARTDHTEIPDGFAENARRTAHRRSARRATATGAPLLAAAGIATVVATGVGSGRSSSPQARTPNVTVSGGRSQDIIYVVKRVKANLAADTHDGTVIQSDDYRAGQLSSDGSLINLGRKVYDGYGYTAPDGTEFSTDTYYDTDGSVEITGFDTYAPGGNGTGTQTETVINPAKQEYSRRQYPGTPDPDAATTPSMFSTPSQVQQALQSGQVTQAGTATIDGTPTIALTFTLQSAPPASAVLYVDAQSYEPLRMAWQVNGSGHVLSVENWMPATPGNIALAKDDSIPASYTEAAPAKVY
jgi:hypothetical protein